MGPGASLGVCGTLGPVGILRFVATGGASFSSSEKLLHKSMTSGSAAIVMVVLCVFLYVGISAFVVNDKP